MKNKSEFFIMVGFSWIYQSVSSKCQTEPKFYAYIYGQSMTTKVAEHNILFDKFLYILSCFWISKWDWSLKGKFSWLVGVKIDKVVFLFVDGIKK